MEVIIIHEGETSDGIKYTVGVESEYDMGCVKLTAIDGKTVTITGRHIYETLSGNGIEELADRFIR